MGTEETGAAETGTGTDVTPGGADDGADEGSRGSGGPEYGAGVPYT